MSIADFTNVLKIFGGSDISPEKQKELYKEVLLMVLARASSSDSNIHDAEIAAIKKLIKRETGDELSDQDVRRAARTELYEKTPLNKYLSGVGKKLTSADRARVVQLLGEVVKSDTAISVLEIDYFNMVANSLHATPAEIIGLSAPK